MTTLGHVLGLAHDARGRLTTLSASVWHWAHTERSWWAWERHAQLRTELGVIRDHHADDPSSQTSARSARIWIEGRSRSRLERRIRGRGGDEIDITVIDGERRGTSIPGLGTLDVTADVCGGFEYEWLLDPPPLLAELQLRLVAPVEVHGRTAHGLNGVPRRVWGLPTRGLSPTGDDYDVAVDAELGVILRLTARIDGEPFVVTELRDVAVGMALPPETFSR